MATPLLTGKFRIVYKPRCEESCNSEHIRMTKKDDDLRDVLREERSRGKKQRVDIEAERIRRRREQAIREIATTPGMERELRELLRSWGKTEEQIEAAVTVYRALHGL